MPLSERKCVPCEGGVQPLKGEALSPYIAALSPDWEIIEAHHLHCAFTFPDFSEALAFTNRVGALAEEEGHHPNIALSWGKVEITLWTHAIDGLSENDFILAAKVDLLRAKT